MKVSLALLESGVGAISYYVQELEYICKVRGTHQVLGPLLQKFFEDMLFGPGHSVFDSSLVARLSDSDVREHVRAVFVPLIRRKIVQKHLRTLESAPVSVSSWRPFQVTVSERRPVQLSARTLFNLVPCNRALETAFVELCSKASDVVAFAKNAGPQCLRIDYLSDGVRLAYYAPDFFVRLGDGHCYVVETKGQIDKDVPLKARAATEWCKAASNKQVTWKYVFVPEGVFQRYQGASFAELVRVCAPALHDLLHEDQFRNEMPLFADLGMLEAKAPESQGLVDDKVLNSLPERLRRAADESISLFRFFEKKAGVSYAPVFTALLGVLDETARGLVLQKLTPSLPSGAQAQKDWFEPYMAGADRRMVPHYEQLSRNLKKTLVYKNGVSPLGMLRNCLDYALNDNSKLSGVFAALKSQFRFSGGRELLERVGTVNEFRNTRVAHQEKPLTDPAEARQALVLWIALLLTLWQAPTLAESR